MSRRDEVGPRLKAVRAGLKTALPHGTKSLKVGDTTYSVSKLDQAFASYEEIFDAALAGHAALVKLIDRRNGAKPGARGLLADFKIAIKAALGRTNPGLVAFGITPERPRKQAARKPAPPAKPSP